MNDPVSAPIERLSERQREILRLVYDHHTSKEIGIKLDVAPDTVDKHIKRALAVLGISSRTEAAKILVSRETQDSQQLGPQSETVAQAAPFDHSSSQAKEQTGIIKMLISALVGLPPLGGPENDLSVGSRLAHIARIAFVSAVIMLAIILVALGTIHLLR